MRKFGGRNHKKTKRAIEGSTRFCISIETELFSTSRDPWTLSPREDLEDRYVRRKSIRLYEIYIYIYTPNTYAREKRERGCPIVRKVPRNAAKCRLTSDLLGEEEEEEEGLPPVVSARPLVHGMVSTQAPYYCDRVSSSQAGWLLEFPLSFFLSPAMKEYLRDFCGNKKK